VSDVRRPWAGEVRFRGEPAIRLRTGDVDATFLPALGLTGVSLRRGGEEFLALPGGIDTLRVGSTGGLPLLAPWANRLSQWHYRVGRTKVDLSGLPLHTDDAGLPIHGLVCGTSVWSLLKLATTTDGAHLVASLDMDAAAFPFAHTLVVKASLDEEGLSVETTLRATGRRRVPVAFGWHPYLRLPGGRRSSWQLHLPAREHVALDDRGIPTGATRSESRTSGEVGTRTFDDLYRLSSRRSWSITSPRGHGVRLRCGRGYDYAQVWVPKGRQFLALEPMTVATNALASGSTPLVEPGDSFTARFRLDVMEGPDSEIPTTE
jgi:aldose 1-epimerase